MTPPLKNPGYAPEPGEDIDSTGSVTEECQLIHAISSIKSFFITTNTPTGVEGKFPQPCKNPTSCSSHISDYLTEIDNIKKAGTAEKNTIEFNLTERL